MLINACVVSFFYYLRFLSIRNRKRREQGSEEPIRITAELMRSDRNQSRLVRTDRGNHRTRMIRRGQPPITYNQIEITFKLVRSDTSNPELIEPDGNGPRPIKLWVSWWVDGNLWSLLSRDRSHDFLFSILFWTILCILWCTNVYSNSRVTKDRQIEHTS